MMSAEAADDAETMAHNMMCCASCGIADDLVAEARMMCCASCGLSELDDVKLKECPACDLVRYCSDNCQWDHRPKHEEICNERAAELRDEILFRQPAESLHDGDCPICFLPLPIDAEESSMMPCCTKGYL